MEIVLVSRELFPFASGGIGEYVWATAKLLSEIGNVTMLTSDRHADAFRAMSDAGDCRLPSGRVVFVPEVGVAERGSFRSLMHRYSARVYEQIVALFPDGGPDLVEFSDYLGEGFVTVQARRTRDPKLARTRVAVRLHTTAEMCLVLDNELPQSDLELESLFEMERYTLGNADVLLWPGGDVLATYERFYDGLELAPARRVRNPFTPLPGADGAPLDGAPPIPADDEAGRRANDEPLRFLYMGRLERRKGVDNLVRAFTALHGDWRLTLLGGDTRTAPLGASMRDQLELASAGEGRIAFHEPVARAEIAALVQRHDVVVLPSRWECWPYVALEAMRQNRPVLATPTGGYLEIVEPGASGWLTADTTSAALQRSLGALVDDPSRVRELIARGAPQRHFASLTGDAEIAAAYRDLLAEARPVTRPCPARPPLVSIVVPYFQLDRYVEQTIASALSQTYPHIEVVVVNDGSFRTEDWLLAELCSRWPITVVHQPNAGLGAARNFGISQSRGRYIVLLDADDELDARFVERGVDVLEQERTIAYVACWSCFIDERGGIIRNANAGYEPFGNWCRLNTVENFAGSCTVVMRKHLFDLGYRYSEELTSFEDWALYQQLADDGHIGHVIPERLLRYRTRPESMLRAIGAPRSERLQREMKAHLAERRIEWTS